MPLPVATIGDWSTTQLVKFIKDILENTQLKNLSSLGVSKLRVSESLTLDGSVTFSGNQSYVNVGATGAAQFANGWINWGAPYYAASYWKDPFGFVHLRGLIQAGTVGSTAFILPPGYRPNATAGPFAVLSNGAVGRVDVFSTGDVVPMSGSTVYVSLDGIYFKAE